MFPNVQDMLTTNLINVILHLQLYPAILSTVPHESDAIVLGSGYLEPDGNGKWHVDRTSGLHARMEAVEEFHNPDGLRI
jgi:hypothetical protein